MRLMLLVLMMALLPLRGWAGEVMATEMASSQVSHQHGQRDDVIESIAGQVHKKGISDTFELEKTAFEVAKALLEANSTKTVAMHDCAGDAKGDDATQTDSRCDVCPACQACHTVALSQLETHGASLAMPVALPHSPAAQFVSAVAALGQKPPIS